MRLNVDAFLVNLISISEIKVVAFPPKPLFRNKSKMKQADFDSGPRNDVVWTEYWDPYQRLGY